MLEKTQMNQDLICGFLDPMTDTLQGVCVLANTTLYPCLPIENSLISRALTLFLGNRSLFCINGNKTFSQYAQKIYGDSCGQVPGLVNDYFLMEKKQSQNDSKHIPEGIQICTQKDEELLFPLQVNYSREEVLPPWVKTYPPVERLNIASILKNRHCCCILADNQIASKGHISAITQNCMQIGGVYTMPQFRRRGYAQSIVEFLAGYASSQNKKAVLFVKEKNTAALHAYQNAGFKQIGFYQILYYR